MSDFLVHCRSSASGQSLLPFLRLPYETSREGCSLQPPWGGFAILKELTQDHANWHAAAGLTFAWVGDVTAPKFQIEGALCSFADEMARSSDTAHWVHAFRSSPFLQFLNGACAGVLISDQCIFVVTDPMSAVQVYCGTDEQGCVRAIGTHPDLVAIVADPRDRLDYVSVSDFINTGTPCTPFTIHQHVTELSPGAIHLFRFETPHAPAVHSSVPYWHPPAESSADSQELAEEFARAWRCAVQSRCDGKSTAVQLSGGLDSRLVMAAIPQEHPCIGVTLCDDINREARIARKVAAAYGRPWKTLLRQADYLSDTAAASIRFTGCEGEWHHAHALGFAGQISHLGVDRVFTGLYMDNNFKGYYAKDVAQRSRVGGLLSPKFTVLKKDYVSRVNPFCRSNLRSQMVEQTIERRRAFHDNHFALHRQSPWEWLDGYPLTQASDNTGWIVERRVMPLRLPVMDRALVNLAFQVPIAAKAGARFFVHAATLILGPGNGIPNANDGVCPGAGHISRLFQRSIRKTETRCRNVANRLGIKMGVPHSWHDYQSYWRSSPAIQRLLEEHGANLDILEGNVLNGAWRTALTPHIQWRTGCRLLQFSIWRSITREYRNQLSQCSNSSLTAAA